MESYVFSPEPVCDVYDSKLHDYRYSRAACSAETRIFCRQPKFLAVLPSLLPLGKSSNRDVKKVIYLRLGPTYF